VVEPYILSVEPEDTMRGPDDAPGDTKAGLKHPLRVTAVLLGFCLANPEMR